MTRAEFALEMQKKYMYNDSLSEGLRYQVYSDLLHTGEKILEYFPAHESILVSVSGGSDSDCIVHFICSYFPEFLDKCRFVFVNTGLEYDATKRHLCELEKRYSIIIDRIRGRSVVSVVREYGFPILSKFKSTQIKRWQNGSKYSESVIFHDVFKSFGAMQFSENQKKLAIYLKENNIAVSAACCDYSKKKPLYDFMRSCNIDLNITGERQAEGGQRAISHKSCFESKNHGIDKYMPLWWWSNETKQVFKEVECIRFSDCYEVYGLRRTGCCGCPFSLTIADDLQAMFEYEPNLFKACMAVFGRAYELTDQFQCRRKKCLPDSFQYTISGEIMNAM